MREFFKTVAFLLVFTGFFWFALRLGWFIGEWLSIFLGG
jgi:hypothetical protein